MLIYQFNCGHIRPEFSYGVAPNAFKQAIARTAKRRAVIRASRCDEGRHAQTARTRSKGAKAGELQVRCASSSQGINASSQSDRAWRRRVQHAKRILFFAGPALSIPLADPAMHLMDSVIIGQVATHHCIFCINSTNTCSDGTL